MSESNRASFKCTRHGLNEDGFATRLADHGGKRDGDNWCGRADAYANTGSSAEISGRGTSQRDLEVNGGKRRINCWCGNSNLAGEHPIT